MSNSVSNELIVMKNLFNEGKFEEILQLTKDIEQNQTFTQEELLRTKGYKGLSYLFLGQFETALKIAEELYQKSFDDTEIQELVDKHGFLGFYKTSAKTGDGVIEAFNVIIKKLYHKFKALSSEL